VIWRDATRRWIVDLKGIGGFRWHLTTVPYDASPDSIVCCYWLPNALWQIGHVGEPQPDPIPFESLPP